MNIQDIKIKESLPNLPGIYIFKDTTNTIIYVGKAKSLKKRIASYFSKQNQDWKVKDLIAEYSSLEHILTKNETEALLLEAQLIKEYKPKFNVLLKNGNPFLYILITNTEVPEFKLVRIKGEKGTYFGPFLHKGSARSTYDYLVRTFKLRMCKTEIESGCLDFHMGNCAGNCTKIFNSEDYKIRVQLAQQAIDGNHKEFKNTILNKIKEHNQNFEFEKSRHLNKYLDDVEIIFETIKTGFSEKKYRTAIAIVTSDRAEIPAITDEGLLELQKVLKLDKTPITIDCFDISHFQSSYMTGSCIRFTNGRPDKNKFRRFKIKTLTEQNDYAALQEIVSRRYRLGDLPDVILIDGGKGQLNSVCSVLPQAKIISLAKREEQVFIPGESASLQLKVQEPLGKLLISLRDYAHHFAIKYHRLLRSKK
ncbi:GIY-YIG nuclease family protein [Candidatus Dependentiae bacterium]|nr:GIY-YIG nuclease family protein [Candidatus Dependentiae bacterium]